MTDKNQATMMKIFRLMLLKSVSSTTTEISSNFYSREENQSKKEILGAERRLTKKSKDLKKRTIKRW